MGGGAPCGIVANELDCDIVVSKIKLQLCYYIHFQTNSLGKGMNPLSVLFFYKDSFWHSNNPRQLICHATKQNHLVI